MHNASMSAQTVPVFRNANRYAMTPARITPLAGKLSLGYRMEDSALNT